MDATLSNNLTEEEINLLPIIEIGSIENYFDYRGLVYNKYGLAIGRLPVFRYLEGLPYFRVRPDMVVNSPDYKEESEIENSDSDQEEIDWRLEYDLDKKVTLYNLAKFLADKYNVKTIGSRKEREIYIYHNGVYILGNNYLRMKIQEILEEIATTQVKNEVMEKIKDLSVCDRKEFVVDRNYINLNNGILNIKTGELLVHDPKFMFLHKIAVDYKPEKQCSAIIKFLKELLNEEDLKVIQEWFGYVLYRSYFLKKALILVGERDTGKSTLLKLFDKLIGKDNISGISLQQLAGDKFATAHLYNKHINIYDDLSFSDINENGSFKIATGSGVMTGEYKFGENFQFENYSKLTFSCNKIPNVKDSNDEAYFSRWIVIQFNKKVEHPDKFLMDKLSIEDEISGLLNFSLEGLQRLITNQEFSYNKDPDEIKAEMLRSGSGIANFVYDTLEESPGEWISKDAMYSAFINYTREHNLPSETMNNLGKKITKYATYIVDSKQLGEELETGKKKQITGWRNVKLNINADPEREEEIIDIIDF